MEQLLFQNSHFFSAVIFPEQLLFQSKTCTKQIVLSSGFFFTIAAFSESSQNLFRVKTSTEELLFRSRYLYTTSKQLPIQQSFFFKKRYFFRTATFSGELRFQCGYFFKRATCVYSSYFFRRAVFQQILFQNS